MKDQLSNDENALLIQFIDFAKTFIAPFANKWEKGELISNETMEAICSRGYLGCIIPEELNGNGWNHITFGLFIASIASVSPSLTGLFNVHTMVMQSILKWGTREQIEKYLPKMCKGDIIGAFALTEKDAGSDIKNIQTEISLKDENLLVNGSKRWITFGALADIFLVMGKMNNEPIAILVEKDSPGFERIHVKDLLGFKGAGLAVLKFKNCVVPKNNIIAKPGFAFTHVIPYALEYGRLSVAFTALGILKGCLDYCCSYTITRSAFGSRLIDLGSIKSMITELGTDFTAACHLCIDACKSKNKHEPSAANDIMMAKYFTSKAATKHSANAIQIHGAIGCHENNRLVRYYRDSKILEIIEGSNQICEMILSKYIARKYHLEKFNIEEIKLT